MRVPVRRGLVLLVLVCTLVALCVGFATLEPAPSLGAYPGNDAVGAAPETYVGSPVAIRGIVVDTTPVTVEIDYGAGSTRPLVVTNIDRRVHEGDELWVFGRLVDPETVRARNTVLVSSGGLIYAYVASALAGLWVLGRLLSQWRLDFDGLRRRETPLVSVRRLWDAVSNTEVSDSDA